MIRSSSPSVRNPMLAVPAVRALAELIQQQPPEVQTAFQTALSDCANDFRAKADKCWRTHKPPMAAYWKAWAVNFRHVRLALRVCQ